MKCYGFKLAFVYLLFFLIKKVTTCLPAGRKNQAGSKGNFILLGDFRRRTGSRNSRYGTGFKARFFSRAMAGYPTALIFRFPAIFKIVAIFKSKNRRCGNSLISNLITDLRNSVLFDQHYLERWSKILMRLFPRFFIVGLKGG